MAPPNALLPSRAGVSRRVPRTLSTVRTISDDERRARLARRHALAPSARAAGADVTTIAGALGGLHATDPATVFLAARARLAGSSVAAIEHALYERRSLVRLLGMRRTMFVVPADLVGVVQASSTRALLPGERKRFAGLLESAGITDDGSRWMRDTLHAVERALRARGEATAAELAQDVPALREKIHVAPEKSYGAVAGRRWTPGCRAASRTCRPMSPPRGSCAAGSARSVPARSRT
jgi:hypothetical protein